jgi:hypothetical protein
MAEKSNAEIEDEEKKENFGGKILSDLAMITLNPELKDFNDVIEPHISAWSDDFVTEFGSIDMPSESTTLLDINNNDENSDELLEEIELELSKNVEEPAASERNNTLPENALPTTPIELKRSTKMNHTPQHFKASTPNQNNSSSTPHAGNPHAPPHPKSPCAYK